MFTYLGAYAALSISALGNKRSRLAAYFLCVGLFLIWFMGFRFETGCDYFGYLHRWVNFFPPTSMGQLFQREEAGFALLMGSIKASGLEYTWLNVATSVILVCCYIRFARGHQFAPLIIALLFPVIIIQLGMSGIRQALAGGFLMLAYNAFARKERIWTATWILIGMQFHASVVMFLPIALLAGRRIDTVRVVASLLILGPIAALLLGARLDAYEERYGSGDVESAGALFRYALVFLPVPFFIFYRNKVKTVFPDVYPLLKLGVLIIFSLSPLIFLSSIALHRLNFYVFPLSILLCVYVGSVIAKRPSHGHLLAVIGYGSYSFFWLLFSGHAQACYIPYENTWLM